MEAVRDESARQRKAGKRAVAQGKRRLCWRCRRAGRTPTDERAHRPHDGRNCERRRRRAVARGGQGRGLCEEDAGGGRAQPEGREARRDEAQGQAAPIPPAPARSEEHTSELPSLMRISYAVFCLKTKIY